MGDVVVCIANRGKDAVLLNLRAQDLADIDTACTGDEAVQDGSCGGGAQGELSAVLLQEAGVGSCGSVPPIRPIFERHMAGLRLIPMLLAIDLDRGDVVCVRLRLRYDAVGADAVASQSDRTTWRYAFSVIGWD